MCWKKLTYCEDHMTSSIAKDVKTLSFSVPCANEIQGQLWSIEHDFICLDCLTKCPNCKKNHEGKIKRCTTCSIVMCSSCGDFSEIDLGVSRFTGYSYHYCLCQKCYPSKDGKLLLNSVTTKKKEDDEKYVISYPTL